MCYALPACIQWMAFQYFGKAHSLIHGQKGKIPVWKWGCMKGCRACYVKVVRSDIKWPVTAVMAERVYFYCDFWLCLFFLVLLRKFIWVRLFFFFQRHLIFLSFSIIYHYLLFELMFICLLYYLRFFLWFANE